MLFNDFAPLHTGCLIPMIRTLAGRRYVLHHTSDCFIAADFGAAQALTQTCHWEALTAFFTGESGQKIIQILVTSVITITLSLTLSVDIQDLSTGTCHSPSRILFTGGLRAAVAVGDQVITKKGAATITFFKGRKTMFAAFDEGDTPVLTIILIDHSAVIKLGGGCYRGK